MEKQFISRITQGRMVFAIITFLLLAAAAIIWILNIIRNSTMGSLPSILPAFFTVLGVIIAFFQWILPLSAGKSETTKPKIEDEEFRETLNGISEGIREALLIKNRDFRQVMLNQCINFRAKVAAWKDGQFQAQAHEYNEVLLTLYKHANSSVFSTSIPAYLSTWTGPLGKRIIEAHTQCGRPVTRIFLFKNRTELTPEVIEVMKQQSESEAPITVRVYFKEEDKTFNFPNDVSDDFTIIDDGEALGITGSFGEDRLVATWYFQDQNRKQRFLWIRKELLDHSESFKTFYSSWERIH